MKKIGFTSENAQGNCENWSILSTTDYQCTAEDYLDKNGDEAVIVMDRPLQGYMFGLIPVSSNSFVVKVDILETNEALVSNGLTIEDACNLVKSLSSMSIQGIKRVWKAKKWDRNIKIINNDINFTYRKDN